MGHSSQPPGPLDHPEKGLVLLSGLVPGGICLFFSSLPSPGRCSIFPDLSFVTFDGSHVALFKEAIYILSQRPEEMVTVHVLDCKSANLVTVPCFPSCWDLGN